MPTTLFHEFVATYGGPDMTRSQGTFTRALSRVVASECQQRTTDALLVLHELLGEQATLRAVLVSQGHIGADEAESGGLAKVRSVIEILTRVEAEQRAKVDPPAPFFFGQRAPYREPEAAE